MKYFLLNLLKENFEKTNEFVGFESKSERDFISSGDKIVYLCDGIVMGIFEAVEKIDGKYQNTNFHFQISLKKIAILQNGLIARPLWYKVSLQKPIAGSKSIYQLSEKEFEKIVLTINEKKKELVF